MATLIKQYLNEPENYFRRFRIKTGESETGESIYGRQWKKRIQQPDGTYKWKDCKPSDYPAGEGVYHSSYKNALRMARTHTNIAYRTADYNAYQSTPFVIGIEIRISNNHTTKTSKGVVPLEDICDRLAGKYPKDFKWTGWHPNCRCYQIPILVTQEEADKMIEDILEGGDGSNVECDNEIKELPKNFLDWLKDNENRIVEAEGKGTLPYFLQDNGIIIDKSTQIKISDKQLTKTIEYNNKNSDLTEKLNKAFSPKEHSLYASFEPFFPAIIEAIKAVKSRQEKNRILSEILNDEKAELLNETKGYTTRLFEGHKGTNKPTWNATKQMAFDLNNEKISVVFLPELEREMCADALIYIEKKYLLSDFKYAITTKSNTLSKEIIEGFDQAKTVVLKLENMDSGIFKETIEYVKRNSETIGNILLLNKYGKTLLLEKKDISRGIYKIKIKGFL